MVTDWESTGHLMGAFSPSQRARMAAGFFSLTSSRANCAGVARTFCPIINDRSVTDWTRSMAYATRRQANGLRPRIRTGEFSYVRRTTVNGYLGFSCILPESVAQGMWRGQPRATGSPAQGRMDASTA